MAGFESLLYEVRSCTLCSEHLPLGLSNGFEKFPKFSRKDRRKVSSLYLGLLVFYRLFPLFKSIGIVTSFQNIAVMGDSI